MDPVVVRERRTAAPPPPLYGLGAGIGFQQGAVVPQTVLSLADTAVGTGLVLFMHMFGGAVFVAAAQNVFARHLVPMAHFSRHTCT